MDEKRTRWPVWVLVALLSTACATLVVLPWVLPEPPPPAPTEEVTIAARSATPRVPSVRCTADAGAPRVEAALGRTPDGRTFHVWGPAAPPAPVPLVLLLHGWQSNGIGFQWWFHFDRQTQNDAYAVYPDSMAPSWDVRGELDLAFLEHVVEAMADTYCVDRSRVLVFGFSEGAAMAHHLGCKRPDVVKAIVASGGDWVDAEPACGGSLPVLVLHRTRDPSEHVSWGHDAARRWARVEGCDSKETPSSFGEGCTQFGGCRAPGSVTWCEDTWFDPQWPASWNHTVRTPQKELAWRWFRSLP